MLDIPGLICEADAQSLTRLVQSVLTVPGCLLEVGCHLGLSTATILAANTTQKAVHCLDLFHAFDEWKENVSPFIGKGVLVDTVKGDIMDTLKTWPHGPIAFAFIDHNHRLDTTVRCYEVMWPHVSIGGILAFHDYNHSDYPEPKSFFDGLPHELAEKRDGMIAFKKT